MGGGGGGGASRNLLGDRSIVLLEDVDVWG